MQEGVDCVPGLRQHGGLVFWADGHQGGQEHCQQGGGQLLLSQPRRRGCRATCLRCKC